MIVACGALAIAAGALAFDRLTGPAGDAGARVGHPRTAIKLSGSVENLYPGHPATLDVLAVNRTRRPLVVTKVRARAQLANLGCREGELSIRPVRPRVPLGPRASATLRMRAILSPHAPAACAGATWPLRFRARAVTVRRAR